MAQSLEFGTSGLSLQLMADCAIRVTARSVLARRRICLSQLNFKDSNAKGELMKLPMDGKSLFHGELSQVMYKCATFARDARETSDYASVKQKGKRSLGQNANAGPPFKKQAVALPSGPQVQVQGQTRKVTFKKPNKPRQQQTASKSIPQFQFQSKRNGNKWGNKNYRLSDSASKHSNGRSVENVYISVVTNNTGSLGDSNFIPWVFDWIQKISPGFQR